MTPGRFILNFDIIWMLLLQLLLIGLNAIFACAEIAVINTGDAKLSRLAEEGDRRARRLTRLTAQPSRFLATIQVAITLSGFLGSAFAAENFAGYLVDGVKSLGLTAIPDGTLNAIAVVLITLILSYITLVLGELVPKRLAMRHAEKVALALSGLISFVSRIFAPLVFLLTASTNGVLRLFGVDPNETEEEVSEDDIRIMVDVGNKSGSIDNDEKEFIQNVFEFDDLTAGEIATHRTDVTMLWLEDGEDAWDETIHENRYTIYPVCSESVDNIVGVLNAKDYFRLKTHDRETVMAEAVKPAFFVPDGAKADVLFRNMKRTRNRFAIVLDEYGGMVGIVTVNDLIEQLVGDFAEVDEPEKVEEAAITALPDGNFRIRGIAEIEEVEEALGVSLASEDYGTFGGFVFAALGEIPEDGSTCEITAEGLFIRVTDIRDHQMESATVTVLKTEDENGEEDDSPDED